jgi:hypothetical protein
MRKLLLSAVLGVATITAAGCKKSDNTEATSTHDLPEMTPEEVEKGLAANTLTALDCNGDNTRKKYGVLPGATLMTDDEAYSPSELPTDKKRKLVFYCSGPT